MNVLQYLSVKTRLKLEKVEGVQPVTNKEYREAWQFEQDNPKLVIQPALNEDRYGKKDGEVE